MAGNETTRHTITHSMLALIQHPDQLAPPAGAARADPERGRGVPALGLPGLPLPPHRHPDVELGGKRIKEGDKVVMWFASGNRDEAVFDNPYDFDVTRANNDHVTFGKGSPHLCLGNPLARLEIRIMFEELIPRAGHHSGGRLDAMCDRVVHRCARVIALPGSG